MPDETGKMVSHEDHGDTALRGGRFADAAAYWNWRASTFDVSETAETIAEAAYVSTFIEKLSLQPEDTVFDMGCGVGTLTIALARAGHRVFACDFSSGMLDVLDQRAAAQIPAHAALIIPRRLAWEDDWGALGFGKNSVDVAFASRTMAPEGARATVEKLDRVARRRCAITVAASPEPSLDSRLLAALGREVPVRRRHLDVLAALADRGRAAEVFFIPAERTMRFATREDALMELRDLAGREPLTNREQELFDAFAAEHLQETRSSTGELTATLDYPIIASWAFIAWTPALDDRPTD